MSPELKSKIWNLLNRAAILVGILSFPYSLYTSSLSNSERQPYFLTEPNKITILSNSELKEANIKIFKINGDEIKSNLYLLKFYFWNQGEKTINSKDILEKINISLNSKAVDIVDYRILKFSRKICDIKINKTSANTLSLNFNVLEKNDGFSGQIIYEGSPNVNLDISGTILEATILKGIYAGENNSESWDSLQLIVLFLLIITSLIAYLTLSIFIYYFLYLPIYKYLTFKSKSIDKIKPREVDHESRSTVIMIICFVLLFPPSWFGIQPFPGKEITHDTVNYLTGFPDIPENINPYK